jgi:protein-S-isoprenylcysteine O-methyltransferase Ste14
MLWLRGLLFTFLVPFVVGCLVPQALRTPGGVVPGIWQLGYILVAVGAVLYLWCLTCFLLAGGTPAIFFTRHLGFLLGEEPPDVVRTGPYRFSRNPMYVAVVAAIFGQAALYRSRQLLIYGAAAALFFEIVVVVLEEPHLRKTRGPSYQQYLRVVPRWIGPRRTGY